ncbi:capsule biosynthesis protein [Histidinibacterium aquaticum]|uniref:Capsule biosynthesis protein n=1 Tax=Histidinibacterium aquaticum TaxID=2613962 RepID=A0A5J5GJ37_9RHOB|nr:capsule biosynthesis protein [Histidinibacterium aquaticum]KAA9008251.1 capsule biosynthesis protein [Histidinibacterium aquaticum]
MTTKPKAPKFRIRRGAGTAASAAEDARQESDARQEALQPRAVADGTTGAVHAAGAASYEGDVDSAAQVAADSEIDAIRREGLTGRQLRMARRVAQKQGLAVTSDFDAVRQLRRMGIDPFQRSTVLELVVPDSAANGAPPRGDGGGGRPQLPQTVPQGRQGGTLPATAPGPQVPSTETRPDPRLQEGMAEIGRIQKDLVRRRRLRFGLLLTRLAIFVALPTLIAGYYFFAIATPMYATDSEFVIQQAEPSGAAGLGSLFQGTSMATQQDSIGVQSYLTSRDAMLRLDEQEDFKAHFSDPDIDPLQRLPEGASDEEAYEIYQDRVKVSYDPTEGLLRMEVSAADPETSERFSEALVDFAEEHVDAQTLRLREDQMRGARESYENAESRRQEALQELLTLQEQLETIDPAGETAARTQRIATLQTQRQELQLELQSRLAVRRPNEAQVEALRTEIANIDRLINDVQAEAVDTSDGVSQAQKNTQLRLAEENYAFQNVLVQQAMQSMESAQIEANRQVRYLSLTVAPVAPDQPTYPRAFENTVLAFLIFAGLYLMVSITASILREQVSS